MVSRYVPTPLPVRLDLSRPDTKAQLSSKNSHSNDRNIVNMDSNQATPKQINALFIEVVERDIRGFIESDIATSEEDKDSFLRWLREFHKEYDDAWFSKNQDRLASSFKALWDACQSTRPTVGTHNRTVTPFGGNSEVLPDLLG